MKNEKNEGMQRFYCIGGYSIVALSAVEFIPLNSGYKG